MFTQHIIPAAEIAARAAQVLASVEAMTPGADAAAYAAHVVAQRLRGAPGAYLEFGPYWWAVKAALFAQGEDFGPEFDGAVMAAYGAGLQPLEALTAGEIFKDLYRRTWFQGTSQFWLDDGAEESYVLFDSNMEARRLGPGARAVDANLGAEAMADEPENEAPAPA